MKKFSAWAIVDRNKGNITGFDYRVPIFWARSCAKEELSKLSKDFKLVRVIITAAMRREE